jgi:UDP-N-acetyl-D-mannosaminuronic acid dehydrogenase
MIVTVVGAAGHVGLPLSLVLAESGHHVYGLDINKQVNEMVMRGRMPFAEEGADELLANVLATKRLEMTSDIAVIGRSEALVIVIGTPIDENLNPQIDHLVEFVRRADLYLTNQLIILRSTVSPGTTNLLQEQLMAMGQRGITLVFAPERVLQGQSIKEIKHLPQIIGAFDQTGFQRAIEFFRTFIVSETILLTPIEAEIGKLITNMARYVSFALANEFHIICDSFGANTCHVIDACNRNYPRLNLPVPGPNVGGPCLYKDGWYLLERIPFNELIASAFRINEGMTMHILQNIEKRISGKKVGILGMTFKANNDDIRNSLSFKMRRQLQFGGYEPVCIEPHISGYAPMEQLNGAAAVILMTPHEKFRDLRALLRAIDNPDCWLVDLWGFWSEMRYRSQNGYFQAKEVRAVL